MPGKEKPRSDARKVRKPRRLAENRISAEVDKKKKKQWQPDNAVGFEETLDGNAAEELGIGMIVMEKTAGPSCSKLTTTDIGLQLGKACYPCSG